MYFSFALLELPCGILALAIPPSLCHQNGAAKNANVKPAGLRNLALQSRNSAIHFVAS